MGGLQNIVANSAYVSARGIVDGMAASTMRDKKFRTKLNLPHIKKSEHMKTTVDSGFDSMCVKQPIGKRLFQQYLERDATHKNACELWKDIEDYNITQEKYRFYESKSKIFCSFLEEKAVTRVKEDHKNIRGDLFKDSEQQLLKHLEAKAMSGFKNSMYFLRYIQFKWLEAQPIDEDWLMDFRVLEKGGFGEVHACQMKATGKMYVKKKKNHSLVLHSRFILSLVYAFQTKTNLCLVMTIMNGGHTQRHTQTRACFYSAQIIVGMEHLHQHRIIDRDLKPENVLLDDAGHVRLSDLGLAVELPPEKDKTKGYAGTAGMWQT
uniref:G protein-coupled receptor kinase 1 b n=1 Tax=Oncorhynchus tshawytscha TaxID=74940 RepID=A0A8C8LMH0_ONCTS